jgi:5'-nucleotidase
MDKEIRSNRRLFLRKLSFMGLAASFPLVELFPKGTDKGSVQKLTILHTNDVHSRIDPFPMDGGPNQGQGGVAKRSALIEKIRKEEKNVLLFDAGDIFQGTPYFNYFKGELEIKMMSALGYDAATIGNHDFDGGIDNLKNQLTAHAKFPMLNCNYIMKDTAMDGISLPFQIFKKGRLKIGVTGVGVKLENLVPNQLTRGIQYEDPILSAEKTASFLKNEMNCDYVICLSHLGYSYKTDQVSDLVLARETSHIDLIIGGHTHTFLTQPTLVMNKKGKAVYVNQAGWAGIVLGRIDVYFHAEKAEKQLYGNNLTLL